MATAQGFAARVADFFTPGSGGGIAHGGNGNVQALPVGQPQQQLATGTTTTAPTNPVGTQQPGQPDPNSLDYQLAEMQKVWQTPTDADGKPLAPKADPLAQQLFQFKPEDVRTAAEKLDFTAGLNPELAGKALGGDATALNELINGAVRQAFVATTLNTGNLLNDGFGRHSKNIDQALPDRIKNYQVATTRSEDPVLSHPAVAPMIDSMKAMLRIKNPNLTPDQIQEQAESYARGLAKALSTKEETTATQQTAAAETDWLKYGGLAP